MLAGEGACGIKATKSRRDVSVLLIVSFSSRLMVRMINEWHGVHRGFALAERGIILAFGKRERSRKLDEWGKKERRLTMSLSVLPITKMDT